MTEDPDFLQRRGANHVPLTPSVFLRRSAAVHPGKVAVVHGSRRIRYAEFYRRARRLELRLDQRKKAHRCGGELQSHGQDQFQ